MNKIIETLKDRFLKNMDRHKGLVWEKIENKLKNNPKKMESILKMEETGGEPDVIGFDNKTEEYIFVDCSAESPKGRRSLCYDQKALEERKTFKPKNSVVKMAKEMGIEILDEEQYKDLQKLGEFDTKSQSWLYTPQEIRKLGGAIFADRRYNHVFMYHNGAESYYAARGFRGLLRV